MSAKKRGRREIFECPNCGADVAVGSKACRECGSDANTGWQDPGEIEYASVDIPEGWSESGAASAPRRRWWIAVVALVVAIALLLLSVLR